MSGPKIRVIVEVYMRNEEPQSRLVVPILPTQTIAELAASVARRRHFSQEDSDKLTLFLADGSELFHEDEVGDVIREDDIVHVRLRPITSSPVVTTPSSASAPAPNSGGGRVAQQRPASSVPAGRGRRSKHTVRKGAGPRDISKFSTPLATGSGVMKRVRIALVTPELARSNSSGGLRRRMAFDGSAVSVQLSMVRIYRLSVIRLFNKS